MLMNFSDLVSKVEAANQQNRQQLVNTIMPAVDLMIKRREVDIEKEEFGKGLSQLAAAEGMPFMPDATQSPQMQQATYGAELTRFRAEKSSKAFYDNNGVPLPKDWDKLTPEAKVLRAKKDEADFGTIQKLNAAGAAYPEVAKLLGKNKDKSAIEKDAIVSKYFVDAGREQEWSDWVRKEQYGASLDLSTAATKASMGGEGNTATPTQANTAQKDIDKIKGGIATLANAGVTISVGSGQDLEKFIVNAGKGKKTNKIMASCNGITFDGETYRAPKGTKITESIKKALKAGYGKAHSLYYEKELAETRYGNLTGSQPTQQPAQTQVDEKKINAFVGKY
jgi:hypothetical protein